VSVDDELWPINLGNGMRARLMRTGDILTAHRTHRGEPCGGYIRTSGKEAPFELLSVDPLTIRPNVTCHTCKLSGFIREGRWTPL
jgi:hypothetical protein